MSGGVRMKLKDVTLQEIKGIWGDELQDGEKGTPVIKTNNMTYEGHVDLSHITFRNIPASKVTNCLLRYGDLLIEKSGGTKTHSVGYVNIFEDKNDEYVANNFIFVLRPNSQLIDSKYLFYQLKNRYESGQIELLHNQTTGIQNLKVQSYLDQEIKYVSMQAQQKISKKLDKIEKAIKLEKAVLNSLDALIKSRFNELFGDIVENSKNFELVNFEHFVNDMHIGPFGSDLKNDAFCTKDKAYCMVYEQKHAIQKTMDVPTRYVDEAKFIKLKHFIVGPGDILVSCRGTLGECYLIPKNAPIGVIHPSLMLIKPKKETNAEFLLLLLERMLSNQEGKGSGVKMAIRASELAKYKTINPSKPMIDRYMNFYHEVDKLKFSFLIPSKMVIV